MARPEHFNGPGFKLLESIAFGAGPVGANVIAACPASPGALAYYGYAEAAGIEGGDWFAVEIEGFHDSAGGVIVPIVSQYQQRQWGGQVVLTMRPLYEVPPYPAELGEVRVTLYGHQITAGGVTEPPSLIGPGLVEIYEGIPTSAGGGGANPLPQPDNAPCPPRLPWPYRAPEANVSANADAGRVRRSNP